MNSPDWQPTASIEILQQRAQLLKTIRDFFQNRGVLEVETPLISQSTITDPHLHSLTTALIYPGSTKSQCYYLQTSPEFHMKRLLAAGSGAIFQICKAFRNDESGRLHNAEFTMLEWYRPGYDHHRLMDEMDELLQLILQCPSAERISYRELFQKYLSIDIASATLNDLQIIAKRQLGTLTFEDDNRDTWLNLLMSHCIEPQLGHQQPCFIYNYPATQAALAKISQDENPVAERFEVYVKGVELANGFHELSDAIEQRRRFEKDNKQREELDLPIIPLDEYFLQALANGFPDCAGVALGVDRLLMLTAGESHIEKVLSFPVQSA